MIGYIRIFKPEIKFREYMIYNSYYCGICKEIGNRYGLPYRNFINYDAVFIAILLDCAKSNKPELENFRCILNPTKKKTRCISSESISYASDLTMYLTNAKLKDNIKDDNSFLAKAGSVLLKKGFRKADENLGSLAVIIDRHLMQLDMLEKGKSGDLDEVSSCYGNIIREILENGSRNTGLEEPLGWIGFHLGKWVYLADAFTDLAEDIKNKSYNPLLYRFCYKGESAEKFIESIKERAGFLMFASLDEISYNFEQIAKRINSGIIRNIIYEGLFDLTDKILNGENTKNASEESI